MIPHIVSLHLVRRRKSGPRPKPVAVHKMQGTFQPVRHAGREVEVEAPGDLAPKPPPEWLSQAARGFWTETLVDAPQGILRRADWPLFAAYCETWDRYTRLVQAQQRLDQDLAMPFLVKGSAGPVISPYLRACNQCLVLLARYAANSVLVRRRARASAVRRMTIAAMAPMNGRRCASCG